MIPSTRKSSKRNLTVPEKRRYARVDLTDEVYICRKDQKLIRCSFGDVCEEGLFLEVDARAHGLQKGRKVDVVIVTDSGDVKQTRRLSGVIIRVTDTGIALVTYDKDELRRN